MNPTRAALEEYCAFISNPQKDGVWSMRIELSEKQATELGSFLNLQSYMTYGPRRFYPHPGRGPYYRYAVEDLPPILLPRLFAYLRAAIPQKERSELPDLAPQGGSHVPGRSSFKQYRRGYGFFAEILTPPPRLGTAKRRKLNDALAIYRQHFLACKILPVPDNVAKVDIACRDPLTYFQASEELPVALRLSSPCEATLHAVNNMLNSVVRSKLDVEMTKVFSPESTLMEMYLPMLQMIPLTSVLKDKTASGNVRQALDEAQEQRFVHAIRATGIAAEELLVEIYETYLRDKAPEAPLGNLINDLNARLQELLQGVKASKESPLSTARKVIGQAIEAEKKSANNKAVLTLAEQIQKNIIPLLDDIRQCIDDNPSLNIKAQKINLFPTHVLRCLSELVILRNRVSHRVERAVSVASVGYIDTGIALRDFIVVAKWWQSERKRIDYKATRKAIIQDTVKRSKSHEGEPEANA